MAGRGSDRHERETQPAAELLPVVSDELRRLAAALSCQLPPGQALAAACDAPEVTELRIFRLGDGAALEGLLLAGRRQTGEVVCLVSLYD